MIQLANLGKMPIGRSPLGNPADNRVAEPIRENSKAGMKDHTLVDQFRFIAHMKLKFRHAGRRIERFKAIEDQSYARPSCSIL